jgi:CRISPR/Cas system-associated endonuclease Cas1
MEEFRPLLVDAVVLTLVRKHSLDPDEDFVMPTDENAMCEMLPAAKQLLIARLEARMAAPVALPPSGESAQEERKISLYRLLRLQATRYARALAPEGAPYCPYLARV